MHYSLLTLLETCVTRGGSPPGNYFNPTDKTAEFQPQWAFLNENNADCSKRRRHLTWICGILLPVFYYFSHVSVCVCKEKSLGYLFENRLSFDQGRWTPALRQNPIHRLPSVIKLRTKKYFHSKREWGEMNSSPSAKNFLKKWSSETRIRDRNWIYDGKCSIALKGTPASIIINIEKAV